MDEQQDGITAYHGSPHDFEQFDTSKIGTGEGAQAYGHGLYFAEHEPVAEGYRDALAQTRNPTASINELIGQMSKNSPESRTHKNIQWYMKQDPMLVKHVGDQDIVQHIHDALSGQNPDGTVSESAIDAYGKLTEKLGRNHKGHMYEVHINAHPRHFLDWDKPLSEQSEHVQKILGGRSIFEGNRALGEVLGRAYRNELFGGDVAQMDRAKPHEVSEFLAKQGIRGIKYLDAGSRGDKAEPTHNYVVFDHNDVHIKRKYEQGGRVGFADGGTPHEKFLPHNHPQRQQNLNEFMRHSAVKHPDGRPKVVYHNSDREFHGRSFDTDMSEMGSHFGSPAQANDITEQKQLDGEQKPHHGFPVYLNIKNPLRLEDAGGFDAVSVLDQLYEKGLMDNSKWQKLGNQIGSMRKSDMIKAVQDHIKSLGYDGIVYLNRREGFNRPVGKIPYHYDDHSDEQFLHHFSEAHDSYIAFDPHQIKSAIGNNGYYDPSNPDITKAEGGEIWDDSRVRRTGEGGQESALDFIQNAPLYKQRIEAQQQPAPSNEGKSMPVTAGPPPTPPAIVQQAPAQPAPTVPIQQTQTQQPAQGRVGLYHIGTNDIDPNMTVQSAQRIIDASRAMGINPVFLLPNQTARGKFNNPYYKGDDYLRVANNSYALQKYLDENGIQYVMPEYNNKVDPYHMTAEWTRNFAKTHNAPFIAGDSNAVLLNTVGYKSKPPVNAAIIDPSSAAKLSWGAQTSKTIANELEKYLKWQQQQRKSGGRVYYNTGGPVNVSKAEDTAGNYKKEHEKIHGIPVAIEVKEGHDRVKYKPNGDIKFKAKQYADYGAILGTKDADGMNTDVMVGPHKDSEKAYIIDQRKHDTGKFDEHKVMLGFNKRKKAIKAYTKSYADRHGKERVQDVVKTDIAGLKKWLKHGDLKKAAAKDALINRALEVVSKKT